MIFRAALVFLFPVCLTAESRSQNEKQRLASKLRPELNRFQKDGRLNTDIQRVVISTTPATKASEVDLR